ncbi:hypothetical protein [Shinella sumterensis]|uniref:hypothetical protein n=1 Tax=Shinella sumterensis TaxID=1967501 RepID=UPI00106E280C|nr:hypothetical protein [Shinella sumterensis]MCD1264285.1 hypothetical protein [Shinella sumterensis]
MSASIEERRRHALSLLNSRATAEDLRNHAEKIRKMGGDRGFSEVVNAFRHVRKCARFAAWKRKYIDKLDDNQSEQTRQIVSIDRDISQIQGPALLFLSPDGKLYRLASGVES